MGSLQSGPSAVHPGEDRPRNALPFALRRRGTTSERQDAETINPQCATSLLDLAPGMQQVQQGVCLSLSISERHIRETNDGQTLLREASHVCRCVCVRSRIIEHWMTIACAPHQAKGVVVLVVLKLLPPVHQLGERWACEGRRIPISVPKQEIIKGSEYPAASKVWRDADQAHPSIARFNQNTRRAQFFDDCRIGPRRIPCRAMRNDLRRIVINLRVQHSKWTKNTAAHKRRERLVADHLYDFGEEHVIDIPIRPLRSRSKFEMIGPERVPNRLIPREVIERR